MHSFPFKTSFWFDETVSTRAALNKDDSVDVAIIGGGFAGLSAAIDLKQARPDLRVALVEAQHVGYGASGRNAGWLSSLPPLTWLLDDLDNPRRLEEIQWATRFVKEAHAALKATTEREGIDCDWAASQHTLVARNAIERATLKMIAPRFEAIGVATHWYGQSDMNSLVGYAAQTAVAYPIATIHPYKLVQGLRKVAIDLQVEIYEQTAIREIQTSKDSITLRTEAGSTLKAEKVILATNAYTDRINLQQARPATSITHTYMLATAPLDEAMQQRISRAAKPFGDPSLSFYIGRLHRNQFLFNGIDRHSENTLADDQHTPSYTRLYAEMLRRFPFLKDVPIVAAWGGATQQTKSDAPIVQAAAGYPNLIFNIGYGGSSGIGAALSSGRLTTDLVLGAKSQDADAQRMRSLLANSRFPLMGPVRAVSGVLRHLITGAFQ